MTYIIVYDISDDKCRAKIAKYLEGKGHRVQGSVFETRKTTDEIALMKKQLFKMVDEEGNIRIYPVCEECYKKAVTIGEEVKIIGKKGYVIF